MIRVVQINGGVAILGVHILVLILSLHLPPSIATPNDLSEEESKSLWHQMADAMLAVNAEDRDRFLDLCLKRRVLCTNSRFSGVKPTFQWRAGVTQAIKDRFWHSYTCTYNHNLKDCPVDGGWTAWSPWSQCNAPCDARGNQTRTRTCSNPRPVRGGERCHGSMMRSRPCLGPCTDPSQEGGLEEAEAFLQQVHDAYPDLMHDCYEAHCTYGVVKKAVSENHIRAKYWSSLACVKYGGACPVDGKWGQWNAWSQCSLRCGTGSRTRTRTCDQPPPAFGGHPCKGEFHEQQSCVMKDCGPATTETFTEWTKWSPCSVSCGNYGVQTSSRVCLRHAGCDLQGILTPHVNRSRPCYPGDCPSEGGWSEWSDWTECSAACGTGRQSRLRLCDSPFPSGGLYCLGDPLDFRLCKGENCVGQHPLPKIQGFNAKPDQPEDVLIGKVDEYLNGPLNPDIESVYTAWSPWTYCSASCGQGMRQRKRWCSKHKNPLPPCEGEVRQVQFCNVFVCPVSGSWGAWLPWTPCSVTCGKGKKHRYRQCNNPLPQFGGTCEGDAMRTEPCDMGACPRVAGGTWSKWSPWTACTVSCGGGERTRTRQRMSNPKGFTLGVDIGSKEILDCNTQPCPVHGSWAEWGEWSRCSVLCGLGRRTRDRTCTDPAPIFGGEACGGPGTDLTHCFAGPCRDTEDRAIHLGPTSWIRYAPRNRPARFLVLYIHFKPTEPSGFILRRYRQCRSVFDDDDDGKEGNVEREDKDNDKQDRKADADESCQLVLDLKLEQAEVVFSAMARGAKLTINSTVGLSLGAWHEILLEVMKSGASLRVNDHDRLHANFSRQLVKDLDFDSYMSIGAPDNATAGMVGSVATVSVNFRNQDLYASADWEGQGTPVSRHAISVLNINPSVQLPHFRGLYYSPLRMYHNERLTVRLTMALDKGEGLLLYVPGQAEGTLFSLGIKKVRPVICMVCAPTVGNVCHQGDLLRLHQWYHFALHVEENEAELRIDQGKAKQLACKGLPYRPRKVLFVGGRSTLAWDDVQRATNYSDGFFGVIGTVVVNGRTVPFRKAVLMGRDDRINPDGYSRATRITPVFEHRSSIVTLHCEVSRSIDPQVEVKVIWLRSDAVLEPSEFVEVVKPIGLKKRVGTLQLQPGGHTEGIYSCVISRDGQLELAHVFPVFRHATASDLYEGNVEWLFLEIILILLFLLAILCLLYRFRQFFIDLFNKWFGKPPPEAEPMLTEPVEVFMPDEPHLQGEDDTSQWQNYLAQDQGHTETYDVASYGPPEPRRLSVTPGVASERPLVVADGQLRLGENRRPSAANHSAADDLTIQMRRMSQGVDPFLQIPGDHDMGARRHSRYEVYHHKPVADVHLYDNLSYNRNPNAVSQSRRRSRSRSSSERQPGSRNRRGSTSPGGRRDVNMSRARYDSGRGAQRGGGRRSSRSRSHSSGEMRRRSSSGERSRRPLSNENCSRYPAGERISRRKQTGVVRDRSSSRSRSNSASRRAGSNMSCRQKLYNASRQNLYDNPPRQHSQILQGCRQKVGSSRRRQSVTFNLPRQASQSRSRSSSRSGSGRQQYNRNTSALQSPGGARGLVRRYRRSRASLPPSSSSSSSSSTSSD